MGIFQDNAARTAMYWQHYEHCSNPFEPSNPTSTMTPMNDSAREMSGGHPVVPPMAPFQKVESENSYIPSGLCHEPSMNGSAYCGIVDNAKQEYEKENLGVKGEQDRTPSGDSSPRSVPCEQASIKLEKGCLDCAGCGLKIVDKYYLVAIDKPWHASCLRCYECKLPLDTNITCFARKGQIYCKEDYYRLFSLKRCARCQVGIATSELVMRAKDYVYHVNCFMCNMCGHPLSKGDHFGMRENLIYCRAHYELLSAQDYQQNSPRVNCSINSPIPFQTMDSGVNSFYPQVPGMDTGVSSIGKIPFYNGAGGTHKGRPRKRKQKDIDDTRHSMSSDVSVDAYGLDSGFPGQSSRPKRVRTSFKHHQLRTMKSYFTINHNPDAKDLKQLSQKTGLSKRVLQVWFQNARAKWRRTMMRQQQGQGEKMDASQSLSEMSGQELSSPEYVGDQDLSMTEDGNSGLYSQFSPEMT